jgi:hypothetical protein
MNWQLFLFGLIGIAVGLGIVAARKGVPALTAEYAWIKYAVVLIAIAALVYWFDNPVVRTIVVAIAGCGAVLLVANNLSSKK